MQCNACLAIKSPFNNLENGGLVNFEYWNINLVIYISKNSSLVTYKWENNKFLCIESQNGTF